MTYCKTCGAYDSYASNSDNGGCSECWDTENIIWADGDSDEWLEHTGEAVEDFN